MPGTNSPAGFQRGPEDAHLQTLANEPTLPPGGRIQPVKDCSMFRRPVLIRFIYCHRVHRLSPSVALRLGLYVVPSQNTEVSLVYPEPPGLDQLVFINTKSPSHPYQRCAAYSTRTASKSSHRRRGCIVCTMSDERSRASAPGTGRSAVPTTRLCGHAVVRYDRSKPGHSISERG